MDSPIGHHNDRWKAPLLLATSIASAGHSAFTDLVPDRADQPTRNKPGALPVGQPRESLRQQARIARKLGSPFVGHILDAAWRNLDAAPALAARIDAWPFDPARSALALRLNAGLHALARSGSPERLASLYINGKGDFDGALHEALHRHEATLLRWLDRPTQTNEVGRAAAFMAALAQLDAVQPMPCELLELGASAGLNLNLDRYRYRLGTRSFGRMDSSLKIAPLWRGDPPPEGAVTIASAHGVDLDPIDLADPAERERLLAYVWRGETRRAQRLADAMAIARECTPRVDRGAAGSWLAQRLALPQQTGTRRVMMHSMVMQYIAPAERQAIKAQMMAAGARASADRPLAWMSLEWNQPRTDVLLRLTQWCGNDADSTAGHSRVLATAHPYGKWINWLC
jgi:hypothetical protein